MNLNERLVQCRKDKSAIEAEEKKILKEMEKGKVKHGDILEDDGFRLLVIEINGQLEAFCERTNVVPVWDTKPKQLVELCGYKVMRNVFDKK